MYVPSSLKFVTIHTLINISENETLKQCSILNMMTMYQITNAIVTHCNNNVISLEVTDDIVVNNML